MWAKAGETHDIITLVILFRAPTLPIFHGHANKLLRAVGFVLHLVRTISDRNSSILFADSHTGHVHAIGLAVYRGEGVGLFCTSTASRGQPTAVAHLVRCGVGIDPGNCLWSNMTVVAAWAQMDQPNHGVFCLHYYESSYNDSVRSRKPALTVVIMQPRMATIKILSILI